MTEVWAIMQSGGPTHVMNASLAEFCSVARTMASIVVVEGGFAGVAGGKIRELAQLDYERLAAIARKPGAYLGAGRLKVDSRSVRLAWDRLVFEGISGLAIIGGNGSMALAKALDDRRKELGRGPKVIGIPKTIDNDIVGLDHAPGYLSAGCYVEHATEDIQRDFASMKQWEQFRIVEVMGRGSGWLGAVAMVKSMELGAFAHRGFLPEHGVDLRIAAENVVGAIKDGGPCFVVVAEGAFGAIEGSSAGINKYDKPLETRAAQRLAQVLRRRYHLVGRVEVLGVLQRCSTLVSSERDLNDAREVGGAGARALGKKESGVMVAPSSLREPWPGAGHGSCLPLGRVVEGVKTLPREWTKKIGYVHKEFGQWWEGLKLGGGSGK